MSIEIERKFLVKGDFLPYVDHSERIIQAYLCAGIKKTIRIRIKGEKAFITIKGPSNKNGFSHAEYEYEIPLKDGEEMLELCEPGYIEKERHYIHFSNHVFEVDVFYGSNEGLILAELELESESEFYERPDWLGEEVTGKEQYYNAFLASNPIKKT